MSFFWWALVFIGLSLLALAFVGLAGLRLWRRLKELGREAARLGDALSRLGAASSASDRD